ASNSAEPARAISVCVCRRPKDVTMMINTITASTATPLRIMIVWDRSFSDLTAGCSNIDSSRTYRHAPNQERGRNDASSEIEIVSNHLNRVEHFFEIAGDRYALDRKGQFAVFDPDSRCRPRIVSGNNIHAKPEQLGNQKALRHGFDDFFGRV